MNRRSGIGLVLLAAVLLGGGAAVLSGAGADQATSVAPSSTQQQAPASAPSGGAQQTQGGAASATGTPGSEPVPSSTPAPALLPGRQPVGSASAPEQWPAGLPFPPRAEVIETDLNSHVRYLLLTRGGLAVAGGDTVLGLKDSGWKVTSVGTPRSATITARRGPESLAVVLRDLSTADGPVVGWDVVYQAQPPPEAPPSPQPADDLASRS